MTPLVFYLDGKFLEGYKVTVRSFLLHNTWWDGNIFVYHPKSFSLNARRECLKAYRKTTFVPVIESNYDKFDHTSSKHYFRQAFYKIDMFRTNRKQILYLDSDLAVVGSIKELTTFGGDIMMARRKGHFNSGVMVINRSCLGDEVYQKMLAFSDKAMRIPDQDLINAFFKGRITRMPDKFNLKRIDYKKWKSSDKRIVHYQKQKPWNEKKKTGVWSFWHRYCDLPQNDRIAIIGGGADAGRYVEDHERFYRVYAVNARPRIMFDEWPQECLQDKEIIHVVQEIKAAPLSDEQYRKFNIKKIQSTAFWLSAFRKQGWYPFEPCLAPPWMADRGYDQVSWNKILAGKPGGKKITTNLKWWPTTGMFALDFALLYDMPKEVWLYGYNFYKTGWYGGKTKKFNDTLVAVSKMHITKLVMEFKNVTFYCASDFKVDAPNWRNI